MKLDYWEFITGITKSKFPTTNIKFLFFRELIEGRMFNLLLYLIALKSSFTLTYIAMLSANNSSHLAL